MDKWAIRQHGNQWVLQHLLSNTDYYVDTATFDSRVWAQAVCRILNREGEKSDA